MTNLADPFEYLAEVKLAFGRGNYNSAAALCRSALETCMKHRVTEFDPNIDVNNYHDIPGSDHLIHTWNDYYWDINVGFVEHPLRRF